MPQSRSGLPSMNKGLQLRNMIPGQLLPSLDPNALRKQKSKKNEDNSKPVVPKGPPPSMKDFEDLIGDQNKKMITQANLQNIQKFEQMQKQIVSSKAVIEDFEENEDELQDQMAESLF